MKAMVSIFWRKLLKKRRYELVNEKEVVRVNKEGMEWSSSALTWKDTKSH